MDPLVWGPLITGVAAVVGAGFMYRATTSANRGTEKLEVVKIQIDGWERLHNADVMENDRLKAALAEERAVSQSLAARVERLTTEVAELRAQLAEGMGNA